MGGQISPEAVAQIVEAVRGVIGNMVQEAFNEMLKVNPAARPKPKQAVQKPKPAASAKYEKQRQSTRPRQSTRSMVTNYEKTIAKVETGIRGLSERLDHVERYSHRPYGESVPDFLARTSREAFARCTELIAVGKPANYEDELAAARSKVRGSRSDSLVKRYARAAGVKSGQPRGQVVSACASTIARDRCLQAIAAGKPVDYSAELSRAKSELAN